MGIDRYDLYVEEYEDEPRMHLNENGDFVYFIDHEQVVADLRAELAAKSTDAERYRWLREQKRPEHLASERYVAVAVHDWTANLNPGRVFGVNSWGHVTVSDDVLDRIVDAAMGEGNGR